MLHVGAKIVCVNDCPRSRYSYAPNLPKMGSVYTIREIVPYKLLGFDEDGLLLVEIVNPPRFHKSPSCPLKSELAFRMSRFRPIQTTSIDVFTDMLEPVPVRETELV